jgi:hypothetical protein
MKKCRLHGAQAPEAPRNRRHWVAVIGDSTFIGINSRFRTTPQRAKRSKARPCPPFLRYGEKVAEQDRRRASNMKTTKNIMIVGVGGQGTLLTSRILGRLATAAGYDVKLSEVHGGTARRKRRRLCATAKRSPNRLSK